MGVRQHFRVHGSLMPPGVRRAVRRRSYAQPQSYSHPERLPVSEPTPLISVIVPTYRPGDGIDRVVTSLDAQTLPQDRFEVILIDDGSPDDTLQRLQVLAATRPNYRVERIENSGWPSRPRNVATRLARGDYVLYMDHDDSLYPDGLRRAHEYAAAAGLDLLNLKESKTKDGWWCMPSLAAGNSVELKAEHRIDRLLPMVPHKLYRRAFVLDAGVSFPEGRRMLWEDVYFNVDAYAKAQRVGILADTPVYLWHASTTNNSKSYGPTDAEFWDRMDDLMAFIDTALADPDLATERRSALMHQYRSRMLRRLGKALQQATPQEQALAVERARALQARHIPAEWDALADPWEYPRAVALRADRPDLLALLHRFYATFSGRTQTLGLRWIDGTLQLDLEARWYLADGSPLAFERRGDRLVLPLPDQLAEILDEPWVDVTDVLAKYFLVVGARSRTDLVTWQLPLDQTLHTDPLADGRVGLRITGRATFDPATLAMGRPADPDVWDVLAVTRWAGLARTGGLKFEGDAEPALIEGRPAVAYETNKGNLAVDLCQRLRSVVADGRPTPGPVEAGGTGFSIPLPGVAVFGSTRLPVSVILTARSGSPTELPGNLIGTHEGARLDVDGVPRTAPGSCPSRPAGRRRLPLAPARERFQTPPRGTARPARTRRLAGRPRRPTLHRRARSGRALQAEILRLPLTRARGAAQPLPQPRAGMHRLMG